MGSFLQVKINWVDRFRRVEEVPPYTRLAAVYDRMMDHVDYGEWAGYIEKLFNEFGRGIHRVVDGGCGTGSLVLALEKRGCWVAGFDFSLEMIRMACRKSRIPFWRGDLRTISLSGGWDAFLCLYDTIQYLTTEEIRLMFSGVGSVLAEGGLFIWDAVTENHVLKYWTHYTEKDRGNGWETMRRSWYDRRVRCQHTEFELFSLSDRKVYREHHLQRIYRLEEMERIAEESGLKLVGRFRGFTLNPGDEESDRVHFVLRKEAS